MRISEDVREDKMQQPSAGHSKLRMAASFKNLTREDLRLRI